MAKYCKNCNVKVGNFITGLWAKEYCDNCTRESKISECDQGAALKVEHEQIQMQHEAEMKQLDDIIKQNEAQLEQQRQRTQELEHENKPLQFTECELQTLLDEDPSKALEIKKEQLRLQEETYKLELQKIIAEEEARLKLRSKEHEQELKQRQAELQLQYDREREMLELKTANKLSEMDAQLVQTRQEHQLSLQQMEMEHEKKMQEKAEQIKCLQVEQERKKAEMDVAFHDQNVTFMRESQRLDHEWKHAKEQLEHMKLTEVSDLTKVLAVDKLEFEKEMERERLKMRREIEKEFYDRVTTELEVEKADGSRLTVRETQPGLASHLAAGLFESLPRDPLSLHENRDRNMQT